jgi:hypothetical protein
MDLPSYPVLCGCIAEQYIAALQSLYLDQIEPEINTLKKRLEEFKMQGFVGISPELTDMYVSALKFSTVEKNREFSDALSYFSFPESRLFFNS